MRMSDLSSDVCSSDLTLPTGTYLEWGGQFESLQSASRRMAIVIPIVAVMIFVLLFMALESAAMAAAIFAIVPLAVSGGVFALLLSGQLFSVRSEEHTSELQSLMRISYAVFCLQKKTKNTTKYNYRT